MGGVAAVIGAARAPGAEIVGRTVAFDRQHLDPLEGDAELFRNDLGEDRLLPSAGIGTTEAHEHVPVGRDIDGAVVAVGAGERIGAARMKPGGDADAAALHAVRLLAIPIERLAYRLEAFGEPRALDARALDRGGERLIGIAEAQCNRIDAERLGEAVHQALEREGRLRGAVAAELAAGLLRRIDQQRLHLDRLGAIERAQRLRTGGEHARPGMHVGAVVSLDLTIDRAHPALGVGMQGEVHAPGMAGLGGGELLRARQRDPHRPPCLAGEHGGDRLMIADARSRAEAATDADLVTDDLRRRQVQDLGELLDGEERRLCARPQVERVALPRRDRGAGLHA